MRRIIVVSTNFWPEPTGISIYVTDLADVLTKNCFAVNVLTGLPHYPWWKVPQEYAHLNPGVSTYKDVDVTRVKHFIPARMNAFLRMRFEFSLWWNLRKRIKHLSAEKFDGIVAIIPSVAAGLIARTISRKQKLPLGIIIQDLSSAGASQSGIRGGALISKLAHFVEGKLLLSATKIVVVSPAMIKKVLKMGVKETDISLIQNYAAKPIEIIEKRISRQKLGWSQDDFIAIHTGNMGVKQDLGNVISAAKHLKKYSNIRILLIGHGNQEANLKLLCQDINNVSILPPVSDTEYSLILGAADLLLVNERSTQLEMSLPSKLTSYLSSKRPVIASVPRNGATWTFLEGIAELVEAGNPALLAQRIEYSYLHRNELTEKVDIGYRFAVDNLSPQMGRAKYLNWIEVLLN